MPLVRDLRTLCHMVFAPIRGRTHAERLDSYYQAQAEHYDDFRAHLLQGRRELYEELPVPDDGIWLELGGGTGANLEFLAERIGKLRRLYLVDLTRPLLDVADRRIQARGWHNVETVQSDVCTYVPPEGHADVVTFSYSLTMIPDWFTALEQAVRLLRSGGIIGIVDFYVARKYPREGHNRQSWFTRSFWPVWMAGNNVFLSPDHVPALHQHFEPMHFSEHGNRMRYFPLARIPYYRFIGRKR